jgi:hypothetical protein
MAFWDDALKTLGQIAPGIATALGGPVAGLAVQAIAGALGLPDGATKDDALKAVCGATPEQLMALKQADQAFAIRMRELDIDLDKLAASDRDSARRREVDTHDSWTPRILAGLVIVGYALVQWFILQHSVAADMREIVLRSLGTLDAALGLVLGYYFGSANKSASK